MCRVNFTFVLMISIIIFLHIIIAVFLLVCIQDVFSNACRNGGVEAVGGGTGCVRRPASSLMFPSGHQ